ncbi:nucleotide-binding universal stress UspA family protein [Palleronia aestuarii]|uniref:Nucleotide-binding universal stress UspA family protein n=1 Tax=Palleronia aestuarii TaxID=568105 RepID=A0A2W7N5A0_9RHOB|nr:universal stress protein [Palleronia aestuarii]PZX14903.1 nucleotide-binding universal stress UspA family protein [Palleronia aestuarii]
MTRKLVALVDGSDYARSVCDHAAWIAKRTDLPVEILHVLGRREGSGGGDLSGQISLGARSSLLKTLSDLDEQRAKLAMERGRAILEDARTILHEDGVDADGTLRRGDLLEAVGDVTGTAEMILIGKRGEGAGFAKEHLGSNLERIMRGTKRPLFVASRAFQPIRNVLVAFDGSDGALRAVRFVAESPLYRGLPVRIVTVGDGTERARQRLEEARALLSNAGIDVESEMLGGEPEEVLSEIIEARGIGHMVMGAAGHSRLRALFVGSTSLEMIRTCRVPILLVR